MPLVLGGSAAAAGAYSIANSCRFNDGDSAYLTSDFSGTASSSAAIATYSVWLKPSSPSARCGIISAKDDTSNYMKIRFADDGDGYTLSIYGLSPACDLISNAVFNDVSAWYHLVMAFDTAQAVDTNRIKVWMNGVQITSWATATYLAQNDELFLTKSDDLEIGGYNSTEFMDGYMAEFVCIDGTAYAASDFGEFDEDSPTIWKPKDVSGLTFGTKGYWLDFEDSAALGDDVSGNNNDFTEVNLVAADQATDTPSNNFCTLNPLDNFWQQATFTEGNCKVATGSSQYSYSTGTMGLSAGKWYWEVKLTADPGGGAEFQNGIADVLVTAATIAIGTPTNSYGYQSENGEIKGNGSSVSYGVTSAVGDVLGIYVDCDNNKLYIAKDGAIMNSGTGFSIVAPASTAGFYYPATNLGNGSAVGTMEHNYGGCPSFAITSGNADTNGYGNFEYDPSDGGSASFDGSAKDFLAICTKNLGSDGG